ncbi:GPP34 family phosphoprotein [Puniceicoccales bacterium CK1056]|uniref:GPP34 family phosphoprotein n=1 Tax=Oceanipulchritudo coccoides TaxID=2706888 RepID=A0A6B2LYW1_9BACT|nr:GPP34 family phosphoprotein [Oceanipulchritudo coccoides]NDV61229.1 GPP34 family phosphoprotein [Oceanipulchritudo coccoides]
MVPLTLAEQLLLLALDDETGKLLPLPDRALDYALAGAVLADLTRVGRVSVSRDNIEISDTTPVESKPEDFGLLDLIQADVSNLRGALTHLAGDAHGLRMRLTEQLVEKGVLREENKEFLWVFHLSRYPLADPTSENAVKQRLRNRIRMKDIPMNEKDHVLISLVHVCQLEFLLFSEDERKTYADRIQDISKHDRIGHAVMECLEEIQKAILEIRTYSGM